MMSKMILTTVLHHKTWDKLMMMVLDVLISEYPLLVSPELFDECERDVLVMYCHVCPAVPLWSSPGEWSRHTRLSGPQSASDDIQLSVTRSDVTPSPQISFLDNNIYIDSKIIHRYYNVRSRNPFLHQLKILADNLLVWLKIAVSLVC